MKHISMSPRLMQEFLTAYNRDFKTTGSAEILMDAFVGLQYKQDKRGITIHQDVYIKDLIRDFETEFPEPLRPKKLPMRTETDLTEEEQDPSQEGVPLLDTAVELPGAEVAAGHLLCYR